MDQSADWAVPVVSTAGFLFYKGSVFTHSYIKLPRDITSVSLIVYCLTKISFA